ncbi:MAG: PKD domain-containing protein, partial [Bacteroidota bacterium]|nr:PKD domain-containing protein [Bacteroidota bacterium]
MSVFLLIPARSPMTPHQFRSGNETLVVRSWRAWFMLPALFPVIFCYSQIFPISVEFEPGCDQVKAYFSNNAPGLAQTWDFGDGTTSEAVNPVHEFPFGSILTVSLTVDNG